MSGHNDTHATAAAAAAAADVAATITEETSASAAPALDSPAFSPSAAWDEFAAATTGLARNSGCGEAAHAFGDARAHSAREAAAAAAGAASAGTDEAAAHRHASSALGP